MTFFNFEIDLCIASIFDINLLFKNFHVDIIIVVYKASIPKNKSLVIFIFSINTSSEFNFAIINLLSVKSFIYALASELGV